MPNATKSRLADGFIVKYDAAGYSNNAGMFCWHVRYNSFSKILTHSSIYILDRFNCPASFTQIA